METGCRSRHRWPCNTTIDASPHQDAARASNDATTDSVINICILRQENDANNHLRIFDIFGDQSLRHPNLDMNKAAYLHEFEVRHQGLRRVERGLGRGAARLMDGEDGGVGVGRVDGGHQLLPARQQALHLVVVGAPEPAQLPPLLPTELQPLLQLPSAPILMFVHHATLLPLRLQLESAPFLRILQLARAPFCSIHDCCSNCFITAALAASRSTDTNVRLPWDAAAD